MLPRRTAIACLALALAACGGTPTGPDDPPTGPGDPVRGGALYDKWWVVAGLDEPAGDHALWAMRPDATSNGRSGSTTWRCKECHGWDYRGVEGAYGSGSHRTGFAGIRAARERPADELVDTIGRGHGFLEAGLSEADVRDLVAFVREGTIDTSTLIDGEGRFTGDAAAGRVLYEGGIGDNPPCLACHGPDGRAVPLEAPADYDAFAGKVATENPWEFQHKVRFGHPGATMPAAASQGIPPQAIADLGRHAQDLPTESP